MKKKFLLLLIILFSITSFGQNFNSSDIQWSVAKSNPHTSINYPSFIETITKIHGYLGDTIIDNLPWQKLYAADDYELSENLEFLGLIRQENSFVCYLNDDLDLDTIYNFNIEVGDSVIYRNWQNEFSITVESIDSVMTDIGYKKRIVFETINWGFSELSEVWIEDIGSVHGPLFPIKARLFETELPDMLDLLCCNWGEVMLWSHPDYNDCIINNMLPSIDFIEEAKQWNVALSGWAGATNTEFFILEGDTLIEGYHYAKVYYSYDSLHTLRLEHFIREEDQKVYLLLDDHSEALIYNFNLSIGDTAMVYCPFGEEYLEISISAIDYIEYDGFYRKKYVIEGSFYDEYWIEGIGSSIGPFYGRIYDFIICPVWTLVCAYMEEDQIYQLGGTDCYSDNVGLIDLEKPALQIHPNPVPQRENIKIKSHDNINSVQLIDFSGKLVKSYSLNADTDFFIETKALKKGIYFLKIQYSMGSLQTRKIIVM